MSDGTKLNSGAGGDTIATEDIEVGGGQIGDSSVATGVKLPRSKIAVGRYDRDDGDATASSPLPVADGRARQIAEQHLVLAIANAQADGRSRSTEKYTTDRYGRSPR